MRLKLTTVFCCLAGLISIAGPAMTQTAPQLISFQGYLTDSFGEPLPNGTSVDLTCSFYGEESGETLYLSVLQEDVAVSDGQFNLLIGSGTITPGTELSITDLFQKHSEVWLGIEVDEDGEMLPRSQIGSTPFATKADDGVPRGAILLWSGSIATIPTGWQLCDGTNGTPDLRSSFVIGASPEYNPGDTGGNDETYLTEDDVAGHQHHFEASGGSHSHVYIDRVRAVSDIYIEGFVPQLVAYSGTLTDSYQTEEGGEHVHSGYTDPENWAGAGFSNLPPYYALAYIMKI